jgi:hypothetical protein
MQKLLLTEEYIYINKEIKFIIYARGQHVERHVNPK